MDTSMAALKADKKVVYWEVQLVVHSAVVKAAWMDVTLVVQMVDSMVVR